jgi:serine phosphatase RsbU (regulator of sigma subunit)
MPFQQIPPDVVLPGFEIASSSQAYQGETVNGDALFLETGRTDGGFLLLLVDVMGHSAKTVLTMDSLRQGLGDPTYENRQPADLLQWLHEALAPQWDVTLMFATALAVLVDVRTADMTAANAGQPEPWLGQPGGGWLTWVLPGGTPLGIPAPAVSFQDAVTSLRESFLAFTDGVTEAGARSGAPQFQHAGLPAFLAGLPATATPSQIVSRLLTAVQAHVGPTWPDDDTTAVCLRRLATATASTPLPETGKVVDPSGEDEVSPEAEM